MLALRRRSSASAVAVAVVGRQLGQAFPGRGIAGLERRPAVRAPARSAAVSPRSAASRAIMRRARRASSSDARQMRARPRPPRRAGRGQGPGEPCPADVRIVGPSGLAPREPARRPRRSPGADRQVGPAEPDAIVVGRLAGHAIEGLSHRQRRERLRVELPVQARADPAGSAGRRASAARSAGRSPGRGRCTGRPDRPAGGPLADLAAARSASGARLSSATASRPCSRASRARSRAARVAKGEPRGTRAQAARAASTRPGSPHSRRADIPPRATRASSPPAAPAGNAAS